MRRFSFFLRILKLRMMLSGSMLCLFLGWSLIRSVRFLFKIIEVYRHFLLSFAFPYVTLFCFTFFHSLLRNVKVLPGPRVGESSRAWIWFTCSFDVTFTSTESPLARMIHAINMGDSSSLKKSSILISDFVMWSIQNRF